MKNNNHKIIIKLAKKTLHNKIKTFFMMTSICLVTFMLYTIFSVGFSYYDNYQILNRRLSGTVANLSFTNPTKKQLETIKKLDYLKTKGTQTYCGDIVTDNTNYSLVLSHYSSSEWENHIKPTISNFQGQYPQNDNEIALSKATIEILDRDDIKLNSTVTLSIKHDQNSQPETFIVTGIFEDYVTGNSNYSKSANVASEILYYNSIGINHNYYCNSLVSDSYFQKNGMPGSTTVMMSLKDDTIDSKDILKQISSDLSISPNQQLMIFNMNDNPASGVGFIIASAFISIIIVISGYLLINNIMQISIIRDIQYYGQLKTLGCTPKQIKSIVRKQVIIYGYLALPLGILLAAITSSIIIPHFIKALSTGSSIEGILPVDTSFNCLIFISVIIFVFITLYLSCFKPAKLASKISPISALSFTDNINKPTYQKKLHYHKKNKLFWMAYRNVFNNKKRAILVFSSLFLGLLAFITVYAAFSSPDFTIRFNREQPYNFNVEANNRSFEGVSSEIIENDLEAIAALPEIDTIIPVKTSSTQLMPDQNTLDIDIKNKLEFYHYDEKYYIEHPDEYLATIIILDDKQVKQFTKVNSHLNYDSFNNGDSIILSNESCSSKNIGKNIYLKNINNENITFQIANLFKNDIDYLKDAQNYLISDSNNVCVYMSKSGAEKLGTKIIIEEIKINTIKNDHAVKQELNKLFKFKNVIIKSQIDTINTLEPIVNSLMFGSICFALILVLLGILNFVNVLVTNITSRQKELSTLEAIGMDKRQLKKLLIYEGLIYIVITLFATFTIGIYISKIIVGLVHQTMYYFVYSLPLYIVMLLSLIIITIGLIVILLLYKIITKRAISDRLRA